MCNQLLKGSEALFIENWILENNLKVDTEDICAEANPYSDIGDLLDFLDANEGSYYIDEIPHDVGSVIDIDTDKPCDTNSEYNESANEDEYHLYTGIIPEQLSFW